jgi:hypothetical protein
VTGLRRPPCRERSYACIHPETYKYFFDRRDVREVWRRLSATYGPVRELAGFGVREIQSDRLILRAAVGGNPITVIRLRGCTEAHVDALHRLVEFDERAARLTPPA